MDILEKTQTSKTTPPHLLRGLVPARIRPRNKYGVTTIFPTVITRLVRVICSTVMPQPKLQKSKSAFGFCLQSITYKKNLDLLAPKVSLHSLNNLPLLGILMKIRIQLYNNAAKIKFGMPTNLKNTINYVNKKGSTPLPLLRNKRTKGMLFHE